MTCKGCDVKETAATVDVEALIEEQLAIENDLAALEVVQSRIKICEACPITPVLSVAAFINFGQTYQKNTVLQECGHKQGRAFNDCPVCYAISSYRNSSLG